MEQLNLPTLESFIVRAKELTYAGGGKRLLPYRLESKDLEHFEGDWAYHDSYFGDANFLGQEVVYFRRQPVWGMNYFGQVLRPELITAPETGAMIMKSLTSMYKEGRFLGGYTHQDGDLTYVDTNEGTVRSFTGKEWITIGDIVVYELSYHGGLIR